MIFDFEFSIRLWSFKLFDSLQIEFLNTLLFNYFMASLIELIE